MYRLFIPCLFHHPPPMIQIGHIPNLRDLGVLCSKRDLPELQSHIRPQQVPAYKTKALEDSHECTALHTEHQLLHTWNRHTAHC